MLAIAQEKWSPAQFDRDDQREPAELLERHPDVLALKEACAHLHGLDIGAHVRIGAVADAPIVAWAIERKARHHRSAPREESITGKFALHVCEYDYYEVDDVVGVRVTIAVRTPCPGRCK